MLYLNLRLLSDLLLLSMEEGNSLQQVGPLIAMTFNRALERVRLIAPQSSALSSLHPAVAWDRPIDLYVPVCTVLSVYRFELERRGAAIVGGPAGNPGHLDPE